jgi:3-hydroxybutyrate dehydrogenase
VAPVEDFPPERWDAIIALSLTAIFHATRAVLGGVKSRGWSLIVNIASAHGLVASHSNGTYVAAKCGVVGLSKVVAREAAEAGVACNIVGPSYELSRLRETQIDAQATAHRIPREQVVRDVLLKYQPTQQFATVAEVAGTVAYLCAPAAASITGASITVDGGWTVH